MAGCRPSATSRTTTPGRSWPGCGCRRTTRRPKVTSRHRRRCRRRGRSSHGERRARRPGAVRVEGDLARGPGRLPAPLLRPRRLGNLVPLGLQPVGERLDPGEGSRGGGVGWQQRLLDRRLHRAPDAGRDPHRAGAEEPEEGVGRLPGENAYLLLGGGLCAALVGIIAFYYSRGRRDRVEKANRVPEIPAAVELVIRRCYYHD